MVTRWELPRLRGEPAQKFCNNGNRSARGARNAGWYDTWPAYERPGRSTPGQTAGSCVRRVLRAAATRPRAAARGAHAPPATRRRRLCAAVRRPLSACGRPASPAVPPGVDGERTCVLSWRHERRVPRGTVPHWFEPSTAHLTKALLARGCCLFEERTRWACGCPARRGQRTRGPAPSMCRPRRRR